MTAWSVQVEDGIGASVGQAADFDPTTIKGSMSVVLESGNERLVAVFDIDLRTWIPVGA